jgi:hypothetical protein
MYLVEGKLTRGRNRPLGEELRMKQVTSKKIKMLTLLGECGCLAQG